MEQNRPSHRRSKARRRLALVAAAAAAAAGLAVGVVTIGSASTEDRPAATDRRTPGAELLQENPPEPLSEVPDSNKRRGMVYQGLKPAPEGDPCVGVYVVSKAKLCTHGPDAPPKGVDIAKDTPPAVRRTVQAPSLKGGGSATPDAADVLRGGVPALDARTGEADRPASAASGPTAGDPKAGADTKVVCEGDGSSGNRVQVLYVHAPGNDRYAQYVASFKKWAAEADVIYDASAKETGGARHIRYVTESDCTASVLNVEVSADALREFGSTNNVLASKGFNRRDRKYMMFVDAKVYCGIGTFNGDERPGAENLSNFGPSYGRTDAGCWGGSTPAHELGHNLGAVNNSAPNTSQGGHCVDEWDIMCYSDSPNYPQMRTVCPERTSDERLDCNHDDYYNTAPKRGSYLDTHWNIANNRFLIAGGGDTGPNPSPSPTPTRTPNPTPTPTPTSTPGPATGPAAKVSQITSNSAVVSWAKVPSVAGYTLYLDGKKLADVTGTSVRVVRLQPGTSYRVAVAVREAGGKTSQPGAAHAFRTLTAGSDSTPTEPGAKYLMLNALTGQAADMWGGSTNNGTVAIAYQRHGYANQQWVFEPAGGDAVRVKSAASGKCLQFSSAVAGQYVAQQPCGGAEGQKWRLRASADGTYVLQPRDSSLVLGVSKRWYYGGWLLELQRKNDEGYQRWSLQRAS
ncbi:RICIN domain-containing protein [Streptomyces sp. LX-29]|uniref:RICIN domain-containing protein n=1 Tax=Streptomyces sp. LX-29 TaxID=2900152 RepID=UPI00240D04F6|nr:RICIN domain-containing protein [Streptomyces sp. LX-29]WFB10664.1 RICIN domain-containing protein [Streptomyces sp. LX-29]